MKVLVVGGTGALGGHAALHLAARGHEVTITGRGESAPAGSALCGLRYLRGDYVAGDFTVERLAGFEWLVFAAGNDPRHVPRGADFAAWLYRANHLAVPAFFTTARAAGVRRAVQLGSFYPQAAPQLLAGNAYIRSRLAACEGARALAMPGFDVVSVNAPFMVGTVPGLRSALFEPYVDWACGRLAVPPEVPAGGTQFMSFRSLSEAIEGALLRGRSGHAYLFGDENLTFREYFQRFFTAAGSATRLMVADRECPLLPDVAIAQGRGNTIAYEPDPAETALLGYRRRDVAAAIDETVAQFR